MADAKDVKYPKRKLYDPVNTSPRKNESARTNSRDVPSTSFKVKEKPMDVKKKVKGALPEETLKRRKGDKCDDESFDEVRSEKKRMKMKREIKEDRKDLTSIRFKKEGRLDSGIKEQREDCCTDRFASETEQSFESSFDANASGSDIEDIVSNDYVNVHRFFFLTDKKIIS